MLLISQQRFDPRDWLSDLWVAEAQSRSGAPWAAACVGVPSEVAASFGYRWVIGISIVASIVGPRMAKFTSLSIWKFALYAAQRRVQFALQINGQWKRLRWRTLQILVRTYAYMEMADLESMVSVPPFELNDYQRWPRTKKPTISDAISISCASRNG